MHYCLSYNEAMHPCLWVEVKMESDFMRRPTWWKRAEALWLICVDFTFQLQYNIGDEGLVSCLFCQFLMFLRSFSAIVASRHLSIPALKQHDQS
jgi:hypothetical protein